MKHILTFYTEVSGWNAQSFIQALEQADGSAEEITILINSAGGNCIDGISVYAAIRKCKAKVICVIDGIAASMASVIWAAGDELYMRDYALLMIHNPFANYEHQDDEQTERMVESFRHQLATIYMRRFGFTKEKAYAIMNGGEGLDGTFFTAQEAAEQGFLPESHILQTPQILKERIAALLHTENKNFINQKPNIMDRETLNVMALLLGMPGEPDERQLSARITQLREAEERAKKTESSAQELQNQNDSLKQEAEQLKAQMQEQETRLAGSLQTAKNLKGQLDEAMQRIQAFEEQEKLQRKEKIESIVDRAILECRIDKSARQAWIDMAEANTQLVETVFASIPAVCDIAKEIAADEGNIEKAKAALESKEDIENQTIENLVGKDFKFKNL